MFLPPRSRREKEPCTNKRPLSSSPTQFGRNLIFFFTRILNGPLRLTLTDQIKNTTLADKLQAIQYSSGYKSKASQDSKYVVKGLQIMHDTGS